MSRLSRRSVFLRRASLRVPVAINQVSLAENRIWRGRDGRRFIRYALVKYLLGKCSSTGISWSRRTVSGLLSLSLFGWPLPACSPSANQTVHHSSDFTFTPLHPTVRYNSHCVPSTVFFSPFGQRQWNTRSAIALMEFAKFGLWSTHEFLMIVWRRVVRVLREVLLWKCSLECEDCLGWWKLFPKLVVVGQEGLILVIQWECLGIERELFWYQRNYSVTLVNCMGVEIKRGSTGSVNYYWQILCKIEVHWLFYWIWKLQDCLN